MTDRHEWIGRPSELYEVLRNVHGRSKGWPKAPNKLSGRLKRLATFLRATGIDVEIGWSKNKGREVVIRRLSESKQSTVECVGIAESKEPGGFSSHGLSHGTEFSHDMDGLSHGTPKTPWDGNSNGHKDFHGPHGSHDTLHTTDGEAEELEL